MPKPNPNRIDRQKTQGSPPPARQGERDAPDDARGASAVGHEEAEKQRQSGDAVPAAEGNPPGGTRRAQPR